MGTRFRPSASTATALALLALAAIVYGRHLGGDFVWDDYYLVEKSPLMASPSGWRQLLVTDVWEGVGGDLSRLYHPVPMIALWAQVRVWGPSIVPLRFVNVAIHLTNAWLFYRLLARASIQPVVASAISLLFAVHPLAVEPAMWLTGCHDSIAVLLALAGMHASSQIGGSRAPLAMLAMAVTAAGAFASKEPYIVIPALYLAHALLVTRVALVRAIAGSVAGFAGVGVVMVIRARLHIPSVGGLPSVPIAEYVTTYGTIAGIYGGYALSLGAGATTRAYVPWSLGAAIFATLTVAALALVALWRWFRGSQTGGRAAFGVAWFGVALLPHVVSLPTLGLLANRYGYFPLLGLFFAMAALVDDLLARASPKLRRIAIVALFAPLLIAVPVSSACASLWRSEIDLFGADYAQDPDDPQTLYLLGCTIERRSGCANALAYFRRAAELAPGMARASQNFAGCLVELGKGAEAIAPAQNALRLAPSAANFYNLALAFEQAGRIEEATKIAERLAAASPSDARFAELVAHLRAQAREH